MLKEFNLSSVIYLRKIIQGSVDIFKLAKRRLDSNCSSKDIILMFDEVCLQKREEYAGGELLTGTDPDGNLYKGIMCFMIEKKCAICF